MYQVTIRRAGLLLGGFFGAWLFLRYLFPLALPFLVGLLLAIAAEPVVRLGVRLKAPRWLATGVGVSITLILSVTLVGILGAALVRELGVLAGKIPDLQNTVTQTADRLEDLLHSAATHAPAGIRPLVDRSLTRLFSQQSDIIEQATGRLPSALTGFLSRVPASALGIGTGVISGFMFSVRLPKLRHWIEEITPDALKNRLVPSLKRAKNALFEWLKAQLKLCGITFLILLVGFFLLKIPLAPLWAALVAAVDAVPVLGTGAVLLPWATVYLFQNRPLQSIGLLCLWGAVLVTRTVTEPRLVGRHLGLDPLVTLVCLYLGFRFLGFWGMIVAPMLAAAFTATMKEWKIEN